MKASTIKCALVATIALGAGVSLAQEFGAVKEEQPPVTASEDKSASVQVFEQDPKGAMAQDQAYVEDFDRHDGQDVANKHPEDLIADLFDPKKTEEPLQPYDPKTGRILVQSTVTFDVRNPRVSKDFIGERVSRMMELLLNAKAEIIKTICTKMTAERVLTLPANPIRKQLQKEEQEMRDQIVYMKKLLDEAGVKVDEARLNTKRLSIPELMAAVADVFKSDYAAKIDAAKKEEYKVALDDYNKLKKNYEAFVDSAKKLQSKMDDDRQKTSKADISLTASMQIHGCTIVDQAEGAFIQDGKWKYQISATYSWSEEAQKAAEAILAGKDTKFKEGKHNVVDWLDHYAKVDPKDGGLADWMGPRTYIDDKGNMWYLGIYASAVLDNAIDDEKAMKAAALMARAEVGFALYSTVATSNAYESLQLDVKVDGETVTKKLQDYSEKTRESFKDLMLYGVAKVGPTYNLTHSTGHKIHVVVYGVNASNAKAMKSIRKNADELAIKINTIQEEERGYRTEKDSQVNASRNNTDARRAGAERASQETAEFIRKQNESARPRQNVQRPTPRTNGCQSPGLQPGARMKRATDDF